MRFCSSSCRCIAILLWSWCCIAAHAQTSFNAGNRSNVGQNDPTVVRPQGHSLQPQVKPLQPLSQPPQAQITTQANGQRVFTRPEEFRTSELDPSSQDISRRALAPGSQAAGNGQPLGSAVQQASWTSESNLIKPDWLRSRSSLELKSPSKEVVGSVSKPKSGWAAALSMIFSLAIVLCLFLIIAWLFRKSQPRAMVKLPNDVVQIMGRTSMAPRQQVYVVRFGSKMLLVSHQPGQTQTLGEITDPEEVQRLAGLCEANQPTSITHSFRDVLRQVASGRIETEPNPRPSRIPRAVKQ
jgi:flagellar biogenesis protein FliO